MNFKINNNFDLESFGFYPTGYPTENFAFSLATHPPAWAGLITWMNPNYWIFYTMFLPTSQKAVFKHIGTSLTF